nr:MAG TPA: Toxin Ibs, type I toxin-antitoxin system [Caudoviricetes sp.]
MMKLLALIIWIILSFLAVCFFVSVAFAWLTVEKFKGDEE